MEALIQLNEVQKQKTRNEQMDYLDRIFTAQQDAFAKNPMPVADERILLLARLKQALLNHREGIVQAIDEDFGGRSRD